MLICLIKLVDVMQKRGQSNAPFFLAKNPYFYAAFTCSNGAAYLKLTF
jgi:hypothetical protein